MPFAIAAVGLALMNNHPTAAVIDGTREVIWLIFVTAMIIKFKKERVSKKHSNIEKTTNSRVILVCERIFWIYLILESICIMIWGIFILSSPLYLIVGRIWAIVVSTGHLLYIGPLTNFYKAPARQQ